METFRRESVRCPLPITFFEVLAMRLLTTVFFLVLLAACKGGGDDGSAPVAKFSYSCDDDLFMCTFDASASTDADGGNLQYLWQFGDGTSGAGKIVSHAYAESGVATVSLTVVDSTRKSGSNSQQITVRGNLAAEFYNGVHDSLAVLLLMNDVFSAAQKTGDAIQDAVAARGVPPTEGYTIECTAGGSVEITEWQDTNGSNEIDGEETLTLAAENCSFTTDDEALTTIDAIRLAGDFDADTFRIEGAATGSNLFTIASYPAWALKGNIGFTAVRAGTSITTLAVKSTDLETFHLRSSGGTDVRLETPVELSSDFDASTGISGNMILVFTSQAIIYPMEIQEPMDFGVVGGEVQLLAGKIGIEFGDDRVDVSVDSDPAYLKIEIDNKNDGGINITERFPQSITIEPLEN